MKNFIFVVWVNFIFLLCIVTDNFCMEMELKANEYFKECKKMDKKFDQKLKNLILSVTEDNALKKINTIEKKLQNCGQIIEKEKNIFFYAVKQKYNISDGLWDIIIKIKNELHKFEKRNMWKPCLHVMHDCAIPQWFIVMLKKQLIEVGFNPQGTNIKHDEQLYFGIEGKVLKWSYNACDGYVSIGVENPGTITINHKMLNPNKLDIEEGRCLFLAQDLKMCQPLDILSIMAGFAIKIKNEERNVLNKLSNLQCLLKIALKCARSAYCIKLFYKKSYTNISLVENYKKLSKIDFCWKALDWLKKYYIFNYHNIPLLLMVKNSFKQDDISVLLSKGMVVTKNVINEVKNDENGNLLLLKTYNEQQCCVCFEHPEDMRDMPCDNEHVNSFICRQCYNQLSCNNLGQRKCPLCNCNCFSYNKVAY